MYVRVYINVESRLGTLITFTWRSVAHALECFQLACRFISYKDSINLGDWGMSMQVFQGLQLGWNRSTLSSMQNCEITASLIKPFDKFWTSEGKYPMYTVLVHMGFPLNTDIGTILCGCTIFPSKQGIAKLYHFPLPEFFPLIIRGKTVWVYTIFFP